MPGSAQPVDDGLMRRHGEMAGQATSNTASTSTATLKGRALVPTAKRAWRPASPKTGDEQVGGAVDDLGLLAEAGLAIDEAADLDAAADAVEIAAEGELELGDDVESAQTSGLLALLDVKFDAHLTEIFEFPLQHRDLTRHEGEVAGNDYGNVVGGRHAGRWQRNF